MALMMVVQIRAVPFCATSSGGDTVIPRARSQAVGVGEPKRFVSLWVTLAAKWFGHQAKGSLSASQIHVVLQRGALLTLTPVGKPSPQCPAAV